MIEYKDMHWELDRLFYGKKDTSIRLVRDSKYDHMFWIEWDFGKPEKSSNFYNIDNAKDNARVLYMKYCRGDTEDRPEKPAGAFLGGGR